MTISSVVTWENIVPNTYLAVASTGFCRCKFDERNIREGLGGGGGHSVMITPLGSEGTDEETLLDKV